MNCELLNLDGMKNFNQTTLMNESQIGKAPSTNELRMKRSLSRLFALILIFICGMGNVAKATTYTTTTTGSILSSATWGGTLPSWVGSADV